jgi:hypothetical protein
MQNMRRRLQMLERLPQFQPAPSPLEQIRGLALRCLSDQDLEFLRARSLEQTAEKPPRELLEPDVAACAAWATALEMEARRMGWKSWAEAERIGGQRR